MQIGLFSVAAYPYSFKLLWSPIVDSIYFRSFGRRKSWLVPLQLFSAVLMAVFAPFIEAHVAAADVPGVTALFFCLVLLAATQVRPFNELPTCKMIPTNATLWRSAQGFRAWSHSATLAVDYLMAKHFICPPATLLSSHLCSHCNLVMSVLVGDARPVICQPQLLHMPCHSMHTYSHNTHPQSHPYIHPLLFDIIRNLFEQTASRQCRLRE